MSSISWLSARKRLVTTTTTEASDRGFPWWILLLLGIPLRVLNSLVQSET